MGAPWDAETSGDAGPSRLASLREEALARAPLVIAVLKALGDLSEASFRRHLQSTFPLLTRLIACPHAPPEIQAVLSELFTKRIGPLLVH